MLYYNYSKERENKNMNLTKEQEIIVNQLGINQVFSPELLADADFKTKWTSYLLSIQYNTLVSLIHDKVIIKETDRIFSTL